MSDIYCGIGEPKNKQKLGTKEECIKKNQVRLYGLNKITMKDIENVKNNKTPSKTKTTTKTTKTTSKKTTTPTNTLEINKENDKKYSISEIKKMKLGLDIHKGEIYMLEKRKKTKKNGKLSKVDQKEYDEHMKFIKDTEKYLNDALNYHRKKKAAASKK